MSEQQTSDFYREYNLTKARKQPSMRIPAAHQQEALGELRKWFEVKPSPSAGGILVLPTGGGKTFTAVRFLCTNPLPQGYKVLWLAHTHHLLEQAYYNFGPKDDAEAKRTGYEVGWITEPKRLLNARVVSGTQGHFPVRCIEPSDDVVICTLQTATRAYKKQQEQFIAFLGAAGNKFVVVFDEAHHSPAPSYRQLITDLCKHCPGMYLLGLTATPTHTDEKRYGWLKKLFPQGIIYQTTPQELMAAGILARPVFEECQTEFKPDFDEREYQKWLGTYRDIPEDIITQLAQSKERNASIAAAYVKDQKHYGKTIMFADRIPQCMQLKEFLKTRGVRAGAIFHTVGGKDENAQTLDAFRRNELDVLVNVRMLTEGTDVPDIQTVFLTRQTTSRILLTQMIGRALRGPKFGGTKDAYIVSFIDNWKHLVNWAEYDQLAESLVIPETGPGPRPPLHLISIDLIRKLIRQIDTGELVAIGPFLTLMPIGWYRVEFMALIEGSDELETVRQLAMVFDHEKESYERFIKYLKRAKIATFADEDVSFKGQRELVESWQKRFFSVEAHLGEDLLTNLFHIARHMAQNDGEPPVFFHFEERDSHDLDALAQGFIKARLDLFTANQSLQEEYFDDDRYWEILYPNYGLFKSQFDACANRLLGIGRSSVDLDKVIPPPPPLPPELTKEDKDDVKKRDKYRCLCCGEDRKRLLQVDHVKPRYRRGGHEPKNLQTLCRVCNGIKADETIDFRKNKSPLRTLPPEFPKLRKPIQVKDAKQWKQSICRSINFFYRCTAVKMSSVRIKSSGRYFRHWEIQLYADIDPSWLEPWLAMIVREVRHVRKEAKLQEGLEGITVKTSKRQVSYSIKRGVR